MDFSVLISTITKSCHVQLRTLSVLFRGMLLSQELMPDALKMDYEALIL